MTHAELYEADDQHNTAQHECIQCKYLESVCLDQPVHELYRKYADCRRYHKTDKTVHKSYRLIIHNI